MKENCGRIVEFNMLDIKKLIHNQTESCFFFLHDVTEELSNTFNSAGYSKRFIDGTNSDLPDSYEFYK